MNFPRISVIVPSYNQGQYLDETLHSIINQDYPNLELFVVDGGSTDDSVEIIKKYAEKISWWVSEKDRGQSDAINKGFEKITGDIVTWINSDDLLLAGALHVCANHFASLPEKTGLIHGGATVFTDKKIKETRFNYLSPSTESYVSGMVFPQPSAFFRRKYLAITGNLDTGLNYGMDYDLFARLALVCDFKPVKEVFAKYRLHQQSKSVAEGTSFIKDWKKTFVNLCKNLSWNEELTILQETGLYQDEINYFHPFTFEPVQTIVTGINRQKALCFQLGHVLKDLYWTYRVPEAKKMMRLMEQRFPAEWFKEDERLMIIRRKLRIPTGLLQLLRTIKKNG